MKYPCKDIIKLIMMLNAGEEISPEEMDVLLINRERQAFLIDHK